MSNDVKVELKSVQISGDSLYLHLGILEGPEAGSDVVRFSKSSVIQRIGQPQLEVLDAPGIRNKSLLEEKAKLEGRVWKQIKLHSGDDGDLLAFASTEGCIGIRLQEIPSDRRNLSNV